MKIPCVKKPCKDCPFREDSLEGWLGEQRAIQIAESPSFVCHKNTDLQCAGHMIMRGHSNSFVRMAARLNVDLGLKGQILVFDDTQDFIDHHA
ncbi:hypothetical protein [Psychrobacter sp.]|uniref:hypothetical protein n=1 Tax=Psychrobacter sp. TaxID=56811 RepID=UPI0035619D68